MRAQAPTACLRRRTHIPCRPAFAAEHVASALLPWMSNIPRAALSLDVGLPLTIDSRHGDQSPCHLDQGGAGVKGESGCELCHRDPHGQATGGCRKAGRGRYVKQRSPKLQGSGINTQLPLQPTIQLHEDWPGISLSRLTPWTWTASLLGPSLSHLRHRSASLTWMPQTRGCRRDLMCHRRWLPACCCCGRQASILNSAGLRWEFL